MSTATLTRAAAVAAAPALRAAIYLRISDDKAGRGLGVERQDEDTRALLAQRGYHLVGVYSDNDISAWSGKPRPGYLALVEEIRAGRVDVIVVYRADRLYRLNRELEDLIDLLDGSRIVVDVVTASRVDLSTTDGRRQARIMGAIAQGESEDIRDKVRRAMVQNAERGKAHGPTRTYGLSGTRVGHGGHEWIIVEDEAAVIREAAERVLSGEALLAVVRDLNARGVPAMRGGKWAAQSLRNILLSARIAGWRTHTPGAGRNDRTPYAGGEFTAPAEWPAILPRETVERLRRVLADGSRQHGPRARTYLLSGGLATCGVCGGNLAGQAGNGGRREYRCSVSGGGCGGVQIQADPLEAWVIGAVREAYATGRFDEVVRDAGADSGVAEVWALVERLRAERVQLSADKGSGLIDREEWLAQRGPLDARLAAAEADLAGRQEREAVALLAGGEAEFVRAWAEDEAAGNLSRMRARLAAAAVEVRVAKGVKGRNTFDPRRITFPEWRA